MTPIGAGRVVGWKDLVRIEPAGHRILIVDDSEAVRKSLGDLVESLGFQADAVGSSEEAETWLDSNDYDVLLLDIDLPRMNGYEMLEWTLGRKPELPVIMVTGIDDREMAVRCMDAGARSYLVKPVQRDFLRPVLRDAVAMRDLLREHNRRVAEEED